MRGFWPFHRITCRFCHRARFCGYSLQVAFSSAAFFALLGGGAFVITELHGGERSDVGFWLMVVSSGYLVGNLATGFLASRVSFDRLLGIGVLWAVVVVGVIMVLALTGLLTVPLMFMLAGVMSVGHGLCIPAGLRAPSGFDVRRAGAASGLTGFLQMALGGLVAALMGYLLSDSLLPLTLAMMACTAAAWLVSRFRRTSGTGAIRGNRIRLIAAGCAAVVVGVRIDRRTRRVDI